MTPLEALAVAGAGGVAGAMNAAVGSGTLVTFPVLLAIGYPPVIANVSNGIGLLPGSVAGAFGYRRELAGQRTRVVRLAVTTGLGAIVGSILLLVLPPDAFEAIVPALIALAVVLVVLQPWISRRLARAASPAGARRAVAAGRDLRHGRLRRLLRCRAGRDRARRSWGSRWTSTCSGSTR